MCIAEKEEKLASSREVAQKIIDETAHSNTSLIIALPTMDVAKTMKPKVVIMTKKPRKKKILPSPKEVEKMERNTTHTTS